MMRRVLPIVPCLLLWTACQVPAPPPTDALAAVEASWRRVPDDPEVIAVDPVIGSLLRSAFAAHAAQRRVLLQNLANVATPAFKRQRVAIGTQTIDGPGGERCQTPVVLGVDPDLSPGVLEQTGRALDVAIDGDGWLVVVVADGTTAYTRAGNLQLNADGKLVSACGCVLLPEITVPTDLLEIHIDPEGRVGGRTAGSPDAHTSFGQLTLHRFVNPAGLRLLGDGLRGSSEASGPPITATPGRSGLGALKQGFLERSNVDAAATLLELQLLERQYESLARVLQRLGMIAP
ncbi:MAG: flagellar hook-basal body complex protein [Planctomycetes bacterium]|nr:flagellar hook-basal body complex protein [Planctomycetota bacterium]